MSRVASAALGDVAKISRNGVPPEKITDGTLYVGLENVERGGRLVGIRRVRAGELASGKYSFTDQDVLFGKLRPNLAKIARPQFGGVCSTDILPVTPGPKLSRDYLAHFLARPCIVSLAASRAKGANLPRLSPGELAQFEISLPPVAEQRRIAEVLDRADALRAKRRDVLGLLDDLAQSIFHAAFTLDAQKGQWPIEELRSVVRDGTLVTYGIVQAGPEVPGGVPYIRTGDLVDGEIKVDGLRRTAASVAAKFERSMVVEGDIVMSIRATVGTTALVTRELSGANLTQGTARISPGNLVRPRYLLEYLRSHEVQSWIGREIKGATFLEITLGRLRELQVMLPPDELQCAYEQTLLVVDRLRSVGQRDLRTLDAFFASLQQRAFSGQL